MTMHQHTKSGERQMRGGRAWIVLALFAQTTLLQLLTTVVPSASGLGRHYNFTLAFLTAVQNQGTGKLVGGAFFLALDHLNNNTEGLLNGTGDSMSFQYVFKDTRNEETTATREMVKLYCSDVNVTAFIGPDKFCSSAALLATSFHLPLLSYDCKDVHTLRMNIRKHNVVNMQPSLAYVAKSIVATMVHFKWTSYWLISGTGNKTNDWTDIGQYLRSLARKNAITVNGVTRETLNDEYHTLLKKKEPYPQIIRDSYKKTRVYVFLGNYNSLVVFLHDLNAEGVTSKGQHVVIAVADETSFSRKEDFFLVLEERGRRKVNVSDLAAFRNVLLMRRLEPTPDTGEDFEDQVFEKNHAPPINLKRISPEDKLLFGNFKHSLRQESFYLYDAVKHYGVTVSTLIRRGLDPYNASLVIGHIRNSTFRSIQGFDVPINADGESEGRYVVLSMASNASGPAAYMGQVGNFSIGGSHKTPLYRATNVSIAWVHGVPISDPECGFDGSKCGGGEQSQWKTIGIGLAVVVLLAIGAVVFVGLRHFMYEQRLDRLAWKIEYSAIQLLDDGQLRQMISPGRPRRGVQSRWKTFLASMDMMSDYERDRRQGSLKGNLEIQVGLYKGSHVAVRHVTRKHVEVNRALKKALLARKEMNHENINRFIGACIETPRVFIVSQFCTRRSLKDILKNEDSPLDDMFITSLVQDLYKGMTFIHESEFGYHGNLKSSKCLVDSRWVLKIADFGLRPLAVPEVSELSLDDEQYCRKLMWRAPELLKKGTPLPEGTQKGDVYSFGIILYELYGRKGPWGDTHLNSSDILRRLRAEDYASQPGVRPFRPDTSVLRVKEGVVPLMQFCWHPDPDVRPDFKNGIRLKLKPIQQGLLKSNIFDNMLAMMEKHAHNLETVVAERTEQLSMEKHMTENLLLRMLPRSVADRLKHGQPVCPEQYEQVSIYFSDIVGFTEMSAQSTPMQIVDMLNDLYICFDSIIENYDVYKVETIGDAYMVVSGLPIRNGLSHAGEVASMSLHLLSAISSIRIRHLPEASIKIRIGIHSGPCCAGVVGLKMPRYCLFGDTVNTASRLETTGQACKIHCSQELKSILDMLGGYHLLERGLVDMKGKGKKLTFFLEGEDRSQRLRRISHERLKLNRDLAGGAGDRSQRCVSASNPDYRGKIFTMQNGMVRDLSRVPEHSVPPDQARKLQQQCDTPDQMEHILGVIGGGSESGIVGVGIGGGSSPHHHYQHRFVTGSCGRQGGEGAELSSPGSSKGSGLALLAMSRGGEGSSEVPPPFHTQPSLSSLASGSALSSSEGRPSEELLTNSSSAATTSTIMMDDVINGFAFMDTMDVERGVGRGGHGGRGGRDFDLTDATSLVLLPRGGGGGGDGRGSGDGDEVNGREVEAVGLGIAGAEPPTHASHQDECSETSGEMRCLLDDTRTKVMAAPAQQITHLLHGRTPETVL